MSLAERVIVWNKSISIRRTTEELNFMKILHIIRVAVVLELENLFN